MVRFALGVHIHQPVDNLPAVIEEHYQQAYRPFLQTLLRFPALKVNFHISGSLLEWLLENHAEYVSDLRELVRAGKVELLGSGVYEPILTLLPEPDRLGQIRAYRDRLLAHFGVRPRGLWLTEQVWEQSLVGSLKSADIDYTVLDDTHFRSVGLAQGDLFGYYTTEDQGRTLAVFPINKRLRYLVPFRDVKETMNLLTEQAQYVEDRVVVLFDHGEKFGAWHGTHDRVYRQGWLNDFFRQLSESGDIQLALLSEILDQQPARGRIYLDNAAHEEMGEWVLTPDSHRQYLRVKEQMQADPRKAAHLRSGYFRNFLVKYWEANRLHKRMIFIADKVHSSEHSLRRAGAATKNRIASARTELYKGQANDAYWHGIFGGLYLPHLRQGAYRHLLEADVQLAHSRGISIVDFDACGQKEVVFDYRDVFVVLNPNQGGTLLELDIKPHRLNWLDTLTRRAEPYHTRLRAKPVTHAPAPEHAVSIHEAAPSSAEGIECYLIYDRYPRYSLLDHFYKPDTTAEDCRAGNISELYDLALTPRSYELQRHKLAMSLVDFLETKPAYLYKEVTLNPANLSVTYDLLVNFWQPCRFAVDLNLLPLKQLLIGDEVVAPDQTASHERVTEFRAIAHNNAQLIVRAGKVPFALWHYPIETVSSSEQGAERITQGTALVLSWLLNKPQNVFEFELSWQ